MSELIISVSGLRGVIGQSLSPEVAMRYATAFAQQLPQGPIVVARDGRTTGTMMRDCVVGALTAVGRDVLDCGVAATPTVGVFVKKNHAVGAVQISASHNPPEYNGIKLFSSDGRVIGADAGKKVRECYEQDSPAWVDFDRVGQVTRVGDPHCDHLDSVLRTVNVSTIQNRKFRVLIDSNHGAGSLLGLRLLGTLGCHVVPVGAVPDGLFAHPPEPTAENLVSIGQMVRDHQCDIGFCQDPDADRLALIDAQGNYIGEEFTVALCVMRRLATAQGNLVINCATSGMTEVLAKQFHSRCFRSAVGEANVADAMLLQNAIYGGEGNGGPIDPRVGYVRDSFVGMAQVLDLMASRNATLTELVDELPQLAIHKTKVTVQTSLLPKIFDALENTMSDAVSDRQDGLRLSWDNSWLLVRGSNTEPIVRLIAEAPALQQAEDLCEQAAGVIRSLS